MNQLMFYEGPSHRVAGDTSSCHLLEKPLIKDYHKLKYIKTVYLELLKP